MNLHSLSRMIRRLKQAIKRWRKQLKLKRIAWLWRAGKNSFAIASGAQAYDIVKVYPFKINTKLIQINSNNDKEHLIEAENVITQRYDCRFAVAILLFNRHIVVIIAAAKKMREILFREI